MLKKGSLLNIIIELLKLRKVEKHTICLSSLLYGSRLDYLLKASQSLRVLYPFRYFLDFFLISSLDQDYFISVTF